MTLQRKTVEYVLALIDDMLTTNSKRARLFHDRLLSSENIYQPLLRLLSKGNWFLQEKSYKILTLIMIISARCKTEEDTTISNEIASGSKQRKTTLNDVLRGLVEWLCNRLRRPSHPNHRIPTAVGCLATLLRESLVRSLFVNIDGVKLLIRLISAASAQQYIQLLYETCLCIWLLSHYDANVDSMRTLPA